MDTAQTDHCLLVSAHLKPPQYSGAPSVAGGGEGRGRDGGGRGGRGG